MILGNGYFVDKIYIDIVGGSKLAFDEKDCEYFVELKDRVLKICNDKKPMKNIGGILYNKYTYIPLCCIERIDTYEKEPTLEERYGDIE